MNQFIIVLLLRKPFTPENYESLFAFFDTFPNGIHFTDGVIAMPFAGNMLELYREVSEHLEESDELSIFQIAEALWRFDPLTGGRDREQQMHALLSEPGVGPARGWERTAATLEARNQ
jgi:hypothetical protein